jgi:hypothetical protein
MFDYRASAELYSGYAGMKFRKKIGYKRFSSAAAAIQFAVEKLSPTLQNGVLLEVNEERFNASEIRRLYDDGDYPLHRDLAAHAGE